MLHGVGRGSGGGEGVRVCSAQGASSTAKPRVHLGPAYTFLKGLLAISNAELARTDPVLECTPDLTHMLLLNIGFFAWFSCPRHGLVSLLFACGGLASLPTSLTRNERAFPTVLYLTEKNWLLITRFHHLACFCR